MNEGTWLRGRAAIVGIGHTPWGKRGEYADKGHLRLVVEAITNACDDAGISAKDIDGYSSYASSIEPAELFAAFGADAPPLQQPDVGRRWRPDGRRVPQRGDGRRHRAGELRRRAQGHDDGGHEPLRPGVRADGPAGAVRSPGRWRSRCPTACSRPGRCSRSSARRHMAKYGTTIDHYAEVAINARLMAANNPEARFRMPDHGRGPPRERDDRRPAPALRLLHGDRLRLRGDRHLGRARRRPARRSRRTSRRGDGRAASVRRRADGQLQHARRGLRVVRATQRRRRAVPRERARARRLRRARWSTTTSPRWS